ncbi:glycoside hydrolase, partial [Panaeolus papilionaceus]
SPIRSVSSQDPNYGTSNPAITCGPDSKAGKEVAEVAPGAEMSFVWKDASGGPWPHNIGPILTYMASCGNQNCNQIGDPANLKWFKIEQVGRKGNSDEWVQNDVKDGAPSTATIPENLAPGNYMVRHEIIALHIATERGKAEFYPGCVAVKVTGTGTGVPNASDLVSFPGAYKDSDPGIFTPDIFNANVKYVFPGPKIATLAAGAA